MNKGWNERCVPSPQGLDVALTVLARQSKKKKSIPVWYLNCLLESPEGGKQLEGIMIGDIDRDWQEQPCVPSCCSVKVPPKECSVSLSRSGPPGQVASCQTAINLFFNSTFSLASPLGLLHKQGNRGEPLCDYYHRKKCGEWNRKENSSHGGGGRIISGLREGLYK